MREKRREKATKLKIASTQSEPKTTDVSTTRYSTDDGLVHPLYRLQSAKGTRGRIVATGGGTGRRA